MPCTVSVPLPLFVVSLCLLLPQPAFSSPVDDELLIIRDGDLPILITAPHGGKLDLPDVPARTGDGLKKGPSGFFAGRDTGTEELALKVVELLDQKLPGSPSCVISRVHRKYIDFNRPPEIAVEHSKARVVYDSFHHAARSSVQRIRAKHSRGLLIDEAWCAFFKEHDFLVGLSVDGPQPLHDAYRTDKNGNGTHPLVMRAAQRMLEDDHRGVDRQSCGGALPPTHRSARAPRPHPSGSPASGEELTKQILDALIKRQGVAAVIVYEIRLPRALLALLVGAVLGLSGAALQGLLRNPLAEASIFGAPQAAAFGAVAVLYSGLVGALSWLLPVAAMLMAIASLWLLLWLAGPRAQVTVLLLAGLAVGTLAGAATSVLISLSPNPFAVTEIVFWLMGSFENRSMQHVVLAAPFILLSCLMLLRLGNGLPQSIGMRLKLGWQRHLRICRQVLHLALPHAIRTRIGFQQLKPQATCPTPQDREGQG